MSKLLRRGPWLFASLLPALAVLVLAGGLGSTRALAQPAPDVPEPLLKGQYMRVMRLEAAFPQFQAAAPEALVASLRMPDNDLIPDGIILGDLDVQLKDLPAGEGVLNLFREIAPDAASVGFPATAIYYHASP